MEVWLVHLAQCQYVLVSSSFLHRHQNASKWYTSHLMKDLGRKDGWNTTEKSSELEKDDQNTCSLCRWLHMHRTIITWYTYVMRIDLQSLETDAN